jgi:mono/diheme cytochrome c family protein
MKRLTLMFACLASVIALGQNPGYQQDPHWRVPDEAAARVNPLATRRAAAAGGRKLFLRNCAECHQPDGSGMGKKHSADFHLPAVQQQSDGTLFWKITNGNSSRGMPAFSKLPELQRWQLVLYVRALTP